MKTITTTTEVYTFDELSQKAKDKAISDHINFWMEVLPYEQGSDNYRKAIDHAERMQTPWFAPSYVFDYCKDEIIEEIKLNEYVFTENWENILRQITPINWKRGGMENETNY